jgi:hypothetical protein
MILEAAILDVRAEQEADHTEGFRGSAAVEHFEHVAGGDACRG